MNKSSLLSTVVAIIVSGLALALGWYRVVLWLIEKYA